MFATVDWNYYASRRKPGGSAEHRFRYCCSLQTCSVRFFKFWCTPCIKECTSSSTVQDVRRKTSQNPHNCVMVPLPRPIVRSLLPPTGVSRLFEKTVVLRVVFSCPQEINMCVQGKIARVAYNFKPCSTSRPRKRSSHSRAQYSTRAINTSENPSHHSQLLQYISVHGAPAK